MQSSSALWCTGKNSQYHKELFWLFTLHNHTCRITYRIISSKDWCETWLITPNLPFPPRGRLDYETSTPQVKYRVQWTTWIQLDDSDLEDDLAFPSHTQQQIQMTTNNISATFVAGFNTYKKKCKIFQFKKMRTKHITFEGEAMEDKESFAYLDSITDKQKASDADVKTRISKIKAAFLLLRNNWKSN